MTSVTIVPDDIFYYDPSQSAAPKTTFSLLQASIPSTACWIHCTTSDPALNTFLAGTLALPEPVVKSLCDFRLKARSWAKQDAIFFSLCGFTAVEGAMLPSMVTLNVYLTQERLITVSNADTFDSEELLTELMMNSTVTPQTIIGAMVAHVFYQIEDSITTVQEHLFDIEERVGSHSTKQLTHQIWDARKQMINYLHHLHMQEDMLSQVFYDKTSVLQAADFDYLKTVLANVAHCTSALHAAENTAMALQDKVDGVASDAMNRKVYLLSILALFVVPLNLLGSLIGMNVDIPGQTRPYAFEVIVGSGF